MTTQSEKLTLNTLFLILVVNIHFFRNNSGFTPLFYFAVLLCMINTVLGLTRQNVYLRKEYAFTLAFSPLILISTSFQNDIVGTIGNVVYLIASMTLGYYLSRSKIPTLLLDATFYSLSIFILIKILVFGTDPDFILANSRNHIFVNLFIFFLRFIFTHNQFSDIRYTDVAPSFDFSLCSIRSIGSVGIILSLSTAFFILIAYSFQKPKLGISLLFIIIFLITSQINSILNALDSYAVEILLKLNIARFIGGDVRFEIIREYLESLTYIEILLGQNFNNIFAGISNVHNSYILGQMRYGVFFFIGLIYLVLIVIRKLDNPSSFILIIFLARCFSDTIIFSGSSYEFLIFVYLFTVKWRRID